MGMVEFIAEHYIMILAIYGAILSTIGIIWNIDRIRLDRARIRVKTSLGFFSGTSQDDKIFFFIKAINFGRRPINLSSVGIRSSSGGNIIMTRVSLPSRLEEGKSHNEFIEVEKLRKRPDIGGSKHHRVEQFYDMSTDPETWKEITPVVITKYITYCFC